MSLKVSDRPSAIQHNLSAGGPPAREVTTPPHRHLFTRREYYRMGDAGLFTGKHVELVEGEVLDMRPVKSAHSTAVTLADDVLRAKFRRRGFVVRVRQPLAVDNKTEVEPDLSLVRGHVRDYTKGHPSTAALIIEVADSLQYDRTTKSRLYARAGVPEYWIVDLVHMHLEVRRQPARVPKKLDGEEYGLISIHRTRETVRPLAAPDVKIAVKDLLP